MILTKHSITIVLILVALGLKSQKKDYYLAVKGGVWAVRGETSSDNLEDLSLGSNFALMHGVPLKDNRFELNTEFDYGIADINREVRVTNASRSTYRATVQQTAFSLGLRTYLNAPSGSTRKTARLVNLYGAVFSGMLLNSVKSNYNLLGENDFKYQGGRHKTFFVGVEAGLLYNTDGHFNFGLYVNLRHGFDDYWDGLKGQSGSNDFVARSGISFSYLL